jgi:hypothetical protein
MTDAGPSTGPRRASMVLVGDPRGVRAESMPTDVRDSVTCVDAIVWAVCGDGPVSSYVHGSLALGGFNPLRSDIDVLAVFADDPPLDIATLQHLGNQLTTLPAVARGLELSIVTATAAHTPSAPWPFLLHVATAPTGTKVVIGDGRRGDADLLMHYVVTLAAGIVVRGEPPAATIGPVERDLVLRYLADELTWAETNAQEAYGVLNAARASSFLHDGLIVSKIGGGRRALTTDGPTDLLTQALHVQHGHADDRPPTDPAVQFMRSVRHELTDALAK